MKSSEHDDRAAYSIDEIARRAGIARSTVYSAIQQGHLAAHKIGSRTLITAQAEQAWLESLPRSHQPPRRSSSEPDAPPRAAGRKYRRAISHQLEEKTGG